MGRRGFVLLEVLAAAFILTLTAAAALDLLSTARLSQAHGHNDARIADCAEDRLVAIVSTAGGGDACGELFTGMTTFPDGDFDDVHIDIRSRDGHRTTFETVRRA